MVTNLVIAFHSGDLLCSCIGIAMTVLPAFVVAPASTPALARCSILLVTLIRTALALDQSAGAYRQLL